MSVTTDGDDLRSEASGHLKYLSELASQLGTTDIVAQYFDPVIGRWSDLRAEARRWRAAGEVAGQAATDVDGPLGSLDAVWEGANADAFVAYVREITLAGGAVEDVFVSMADALDEVASGLSQIGRDLTDLMIDTAEVVSESASLPVGGEERARKQLLAAGNAARQLHDSVGDVLEGFAEFCAGVEDGKSTGAGVDLAHRYPDERFVLGEPRPRANPPVAGDSGAGAVGGHLTMYDWAEEESPDTPADGTTPASAAQESPADPGHGAVGDVGHQTAAVPPVDHAPGIAVPEAEVVAPGQPRGAQGAPMMGMVPMGMGGLGQAGAERQRKGKARPQTDPKELFGKPDRVAPPVIGKD
ncbi:endo-1,4-beta-glucanase [Amycolatopsis minnesotensis]|uniref:WXG100 family type VII secretion target n=1 Tax=Amycolatopsis minnesotensis TaxID=337894 RepID=A0ABN2QAB8_9PSEU